MVEKGIRQYIKVNISQTLGVQNNAYVPEKETKLYVYNVAKDPKELPVTKDTAVPKHDISKPIVQAAPKDKQNNNIVWKNMTVKEKIQSITNANSQIPDIEFSNKDKEILRKLELEHEKNIPSKAVDSTISSIIKTQKKKRIHAEPEEKLKSKLPVKPKQSVSIRITFCFVMSVICFILSIMYVSLFNLYHSYHLLLEREKFLLRDCKEW